MNQKGIIATLIISFLFAWNTDAAFDRRETRQQNIKNERQINKKEPTILFISPFTNHPLVDLQNSPSRIAPPGKDNDDDNQTGAPIGNAIPFILGLALIYGIKKALEKKAIHNS